MGRIIYVKGKPRPHRRFSGVNFYLLFILLLSDVSVRPTIVNLFYAKPIVVALLAAMSANLSAEETKNPPIDPSKAIDKGVAMPTPLDKFIALTLLVKTKKIDWNGVFNAVAVDINPDNYTDTEILIPQVLGLRIADGIMAVQAKDAELLGKAASDIEKLALKLKVNDNDLSRARRVRSLANEGKWLDVYRELGFLQQDIMQKLEENPNDQRSSLLMISGWIQGSRYSSRLILAHYSDESSNILREPLLVKALIDKSNGLPAKTKEAPSVAIISKTLPSLHKIVNVSIDAPIPKAQVESLDQLATACVKEIIKGK